MRCDAAGSGSLHAADRPGLVDATAEWVDVVAGSNRLPGGDHRRTHSRRPDRLTPSPQLLRMAVARLRVRPHPAVAGNAYEAYALVVEPGSLRAPRTISHVLELGGQVALTIAPLLMLLFPTGRLPSRQW